MATGNVALPPLGKISLIGVWIETVLYGVNCVMYGLCMYTLLHGGKIATQRWVLLAVSTIVFLLGTVHVGASLRQLLEAFIYAPADVPNYSTIHWLQLTTAREVKDYIYDTLLFFQDFILVWRLYVVFVRNWRVVVFPVILAAGRLATTYAASGVPKPHNGQVLGGPVTASLIISAITLELTLNTSVTVAIATRLWWISRRAASMTATSTTGFRFTIYLVIESGAITAVATAVVLALLLSNSPLALSAFDVISQLDVLIPLLIVVQVGLAGHKRVLSGTSSKPTLTPQDQMVFRVGAPRDQDSSLSSTLHTIPSRSSDLAHNPSS